LGGKEVKKYIFILCLLLTFNLIVRIAILNNQYISGYLAGWKHCKEISDNKYKRLKGNYDLLRSNYEDSLRRICKLTDNKEFINIDRGDLK